MGPFFSSLRTGILTQLILLIIAAMLLINVVMVKFAERDLIQAQIRTARLLITGLEQLLEDEQAKGIQGAAVPNTILQEKAARMASAGGFSDITIIDPAGKVLLEPPLSSRDKVVRLLNAREAAATGVWSNRFIGSTWGVLWLESDDLIISAPLHSRGKPSGGIAVGIPLSPLYNDLRQSEKVILLYIFLDTLILAAVGLYLISRLIIRPVHKLLKMTEEYKEGDLFPSVGEGTGNEIGDLSRSLGVMVKRLDENKRALKNQLESLQKANQELRQAQSEIIQSEKLASVGRLAAGIAHEIGNPIGIILGYLDLIRQQETTEEEKRDFLERIESETSRVNQIIRQLLDFSRPSSGRPESVHSHRLIADTLNMLEPQPMMEGIRVLLELGAEEDRIIIDPNRLQQVFFNILVNAVDAFGSFEPTASSEAHDADKQKANKEIKISSLVLDGSMEWRFTDNGPGIPESELRQIFDPFYTTKAPGRGTGLGLAVCYRILQEAGGRIRAESEVGKGTSIILLLPLRRAES